MRKRVLLTLIGLVLLVALNTGLGLLAGPTYADLVMVWSLLSGMLYGAAAVLWITESK